MLHKGTKQNKKCNENINIGADTFINSPAPPDSPRHYNIQVFLKIHKKKLN